MKTVRLLYPDYVSGGLETYYFGAKLLRYILPKNDDQELLEVDIPAPTGKNYTVTDGIYAKELVLEGLNKATDILEKTAPDRIITIGGNCFVSQAPFDYLHGKYDNVGIIWLDAHPDVSTVNDGYPNAHAFVLGSLLGADNNPFASLKKNGDFKPEQLLYIGLQGLHNYQESYLNGIGVDYKIQTESFISDEIIKDFASKFDHILIHLDIDVLDARLFHSTYFANPELVGDGSGSGKMTLDELSNTIHLIDECSDVVGFTIAEYLPFDEENLSKIFKNIKIFEDKEL